MATYDYTARAEYFLSDGTISSSSFTFGMLANQEGGNVIQDGNTIVDGDTPIGQYAGTIELEGSMFIVVDVGDGMIAVFSSVNPETFVFPSSIDPSQINPDPVIVCFLAGTLIATPVGERRVEDLAAGDLVLTAAGETRPVLWIGRQTVAALFADPLRSYPIRIAAGALAEGVPARDLCVSPDHALLVDDVLVQAGALVNGTTITRVQRLQARFTYYHIELEDHAVVLAEGAPAETFVDNVTRRRFDNYAEYEALFGESRARIPELDLPRVKSARQLPRAARERLATRAEALGYVSAAAA